MQYFPKPKSLTQAMIQSFKSFVQIVFWSSALFALVFFIALFNGSKFAVDMLALGSNPFSLSVLLAGALVLSVLVTVGHLSLFMRSKKMAKSTVQLAGSLVVAPYIKVQKSVSDLRGTQKQSRRPNRVLTSA